MTTDMYLEQLLAHLPRTTPSRQQIALELRGHIEERLAGGEPLADVLRQLGDPAVLAESYLAGVSLTPRRDLAACDGQGHRPAGPAARRSPCSRRWPG